MTATDLKRSGIRSAATTPTAVDLAELIRQQAAKWPERAALTFEGASLTYEDLDRRATRVANGLFALSETMQGRVAVLDKNSDAFYEVWFGCAKAHKVLVPVNWRLAPAEIAYILNDSGAEFLFVGPEFFGVIDQIRQQLSTIKRIVGVSGTHPEWEPYVAWRDRQPDADPCLCNGPNDVAIQLYTSGTTGHPKGVQLTHANVFAAIAAAPEWYPCGADDVSLACMPQFHIAGSVLGLFSVYRAARTVIVRETAPAEILRLIPSERVTLTFLVPSLLLFMLQTSGCEDVDFSSLRRIVYGASPIAVDVLRAALATFKCDFCHLYGLTETTGVVTCLPPEAHSLSDTGPRLRSCGKPLSNAEIKVVGADDAEVQSGQIGEIIARSPQNMLGYWNLPEATAMTIRNGWLHTGDAGYVDADGYLYIHDRIKDMIISGGENVYPAEVENVLFSHPAVADAAVIGVPDARWGEAVKAVVVVVVQAATTETELIEYCRERIAHYKAPKSVDFVESLPRNPSGKVLKRELRAPYWTRHERQVN
jgi:acyl-CoA synthetase (AMP-forming)/AMP-acid ligase II